MNIVNLNKLIEFLESECATQHFNMKQWIKPVRGKGFPATQQEIEEFENACGTACCIGGWAQLMHIKDGYKRHINSAEAYLGLDHEIAHELFYPTDPYIYLKDPKLAAKVLRHLVETGEVDWSIIDDDIAAIVAPI